MRSLYFGCHRDTGHYLWAPDPQFDLVRMDMSKCPFGAYIDSIFLPSQALQGQVFHTKIGDYTVISFVDYSVDDRHGSHSEFIIKGRVEYDEAMQIIREEFPQIFRRFQFELVRTA